MEVRDIPIESWRAFDAIFSDPETKFGYKSWIYRGLPCKSWKLKSTLLRDLEKLRIIPSKSWKPREREALNNFKQSAHHHLRHVPLESRDDTLEWWSLMQHFGAPTRLLDWTYSPYTAAFFAIEDSLGWNESTSEPEFNDFCVYALYVQNIIGQNKKRQYDISRYDYLSEDGPYFNKDFHYPNDMFVRLYRPRLQNERLIAQQGVFTVQNVIDMSFEDVLRKYDENDRDAEKGFVRFVFKNDAVRFGKYISVLHRMNISNASLFPGIEGLSKSLHLGLMNIASKF